MITSGVGFCIYFVILLINNTSMDTSSAHSETLQRHKNVHDINNINSGLYETISKHDIAAKHSATSDIVFDFTSYKTWPLCWCRSLPNESRFASLHHSD